jgi:hypothetical protein
VAPGLGAGNSSLGVSAACAALKNNPEANAKEGMMIFGSMGRNLTPLLGKKSGKWPGLDAWIFI